MKRVQWLWFVAALLLVGCSNNRQDVTHDPGYGNFGAIMGRWKTKVPMCLVKSPTQMNIAGDYLFLSSADYVSPQDNVLADLPIGSVIRVERLVFVPSWEASLLGVTGSMTAGPFANQEAQISGLLFAKDLVATIEYTHGDPSAINTTWTVDPNMLEK